MKWNEKKNLIFINFSTSTIFINNNCNDRWQCPSIGSNRFNQTSYFFNVVVDHKKIKWNEFQFNSINKHYHHWYIRSHFITNKNYINGSLNDAYIFRYISRILIFFFLIDPSKNEWVLTLKGMNRFSSWSSSLSWWRLQFFQINLACAANTFCYKLHFLLISNVRNDQEKQPTLTKYGPSITTTTLTYCTKTFLPPPIYFRTVHVVWFSLAILYFSNWNPTKTDHIYIWYEVRDQGHFVWWSLFVENILHDLFSVWNHHIIIGFVFYLSFLFWI